MFKPYLSCCVNGRKIEGMYYGFLDLFILLLLLLHSKCHVLVRWSGLENEYWRKIDKDIKNY